MKHISIAVTLAVTALALILTGCGKQEGSDAPGGNRAARANAPADDPGRSIDENFLVDQAAKRDQLEKTIRSFHTDENADFSLLKRLILNRKGELLSTKRNIRRSVMFTDAEKDSLVAPLDQESLALSTELLDIPN